MTTKKGVHCRVVRVVDLELPPHRYGFKSRLGLWILSCEKAIQPADEMSVVLLMWPDARRGISPPVKLESRHITFTVLVRRKPHPNNNNNKKTIKWTKTNIHC